MAFPGHYMLGGNEIINAARTGAYVQEFAPAISLYNLDDYAGLAAALDESYVSPLVDNAPWYDPAQPESANFYGVYPIAVDMGGSSRQATIVESVDDGGSIGAFRKATKSILFRGMLMAKDKLALEYGQTWLTSVLDSSECDLDGGACGGAQLCFYVSDPTPPVVTRNYSLNPRPTSGSVGWTNNNASLMTRVYVTSFPTAHPQGITTGIRSNATTSGTTSVALSLYDIDALGAASGLDRKVGVWVMTTSAGMRARTAPFNEVTPLVANQWKWIETAQPVGGAQYSQIHVESSSGANVASSAQVFVTGSLAVPADTENPFSPFFDGDTPDGIEEGVPYVYAWDGVPGASSSLRSIGHAVDYLERYMHDVSCIEGPIPLRDMQIADCGAMREVRFVLQAGIPNVFTNPKEALPLTPFLTLPRGTWRDYDCTPDANVVIVDPDCPPVPSPPRPPIIPDSCIEEPAQHVRSWLSIPATEVSEWSDMAPTIHLLNTSVLGPLRQARVRFYQNPIDAPTTEGYSIRNYARNPHAHVNATGYAAVGTAALTGRIATGALDGGAFVRVTTTAPATALNAGITYGITEGIGDMPDEALLSTNYSVAVEVRTSVANRDLRLNYLWYDSVGAAIGSFQPFDTINDTLTSNTWHRSEANLPPRPANGRRLAIQVVGDGDSWTGAGLTLDLARVLVTNTDLNPGGVIPQYWDGAMGLADGAYHYWEGTANDAASVRQHAPVDPCDFCAEFIVSYLPPQTELVVDAVSENAWSLTAGIQQQRPSMHLLYGEDGGPMTWPALSCGTSYIVAIDTPWIDPTGPPISPPVLSVQLELTRRESA